MKVGFMAGPLYQTELDLNGLPNKMATGVYMSALVTGSMSYL